MEAYAGPVLKPAGLDFMGRPALALWWSGTSPTLFAAGRQLTFHTLVAVRHVTGTASLPAVTFRCRRRLCGHGTGYGAATPAWY
jgi:hypothetical protein